MRTFPRATPQSTSLAEIAKIEGDLQTKLAQITLKIDAIKLPLAPIINPVKSKLISEVLEKDTMGSLYLHKIITCYLI